MKKKLLSTLAAVSMLTNLVTPVLAAPYSHAGEDHYSFATGYEGDVTEALFLDTSYTMKNGDSEDYMDELMAFVNDSLLAHELNYVEWFIENHDSNYPFSLASSTEGVVYCGFDSGSATLTAVITRNDGSLVKASTKLVASARTIGYASGFSIDTTATFFTGDEAIKNGEITIKPTPDNTVFSRAQYDVIAEAIEDGDLNISLRYGNNVDFSNGYEIIPTIQSFSPDTTDADEVWNGYSGEKALKVTYPLGDEIYGNDSYNKDAVNGKVVFEITNVSSLAISDDNIYKPTIGGVEIKDGAGSSSSAFNTGTRYIDDLIASMNSSGKYTVKDITANYAPKNEAGTPNNDAILEFTLMKDSVSYAELKSDLEEIYNNVNYAGDYGYYTLTANSNWSSEAETIFTDLAQGNDNAAFMVDGKAGFAVGNGDALAFTTFLSGEASAKDVGFEIIQIKEKDFDEVGSWALYVYDETPENLKSDSTILTPNAYNGEKIYLSSSTTASAYINSANAGTDGFDSDDYITLTYNSSKSYSYGAPTNYLNETPDADGIGHGLRGFIDNNGTTAYNYTLSVANFPRYQGTVQVDTLDDVSRSTRIDTNVAVQPDSLHQTSSITVTVGDIVNLQDHFKPTSTANTWHDIEYNEAFFNNDSSYAYNDYGVITKKINSQYRILGVREGKNKVVASVWNSADGVTHYAEVIVTVVPRTGVSTTVTPTSNPLTVTPGTHTTTLGGAGVQLTAAYYGEATFDVNDNVLPTLQSDNNGKIQDVVSFKSNDPTVLSVNEDGFVTPVGVGTGSVTVYVPNSDYEATFTMTVIAPTIPQESTPNADGTTSGSTPVPSTGVDALGQLF